MSRRAPRFSAAERAAQRAYRGKPQVETQERHPAQVTNDGLLAAYERWHDRLSGEERDAISKVRHALYRIMDEDEGDRP